MKNSKKILAMILTLTMVFSFALSFTASADGDGDGSIMILDTQEGATYTAYKVLSLSYTGNGPVPGPTNYQYAVEAQFVPFFSTTEGAAFLLDTDPSGQLYALTGPATLAGKFINVTETNKEDFANALYAWIAANKASLTHVASETADATGFIEWTGLDLGYYAVYPDFDDPQQAAGYGTLLSLNNSTPEARVNVKAKLPAVVTVTSDLNKPRYATAMNIMKASKKPFSTWDAAAMGADTNKTGMPGSPSSTKKVFEPEKRTTDTRYFSGEMADIVREFVDELQAEHLI